MKKAKDIRIIMKIVMTLQTSEKVLGSPSGPRDLTLKIAGLVGDVPVKGSVGQCEFSHKFPHLNTKD